MTGKIDWDKPLQVIDTCWPDWHDARITSCIFDENGKAIYFWVQTYDACRSAMVDLNGNILAGYISIKIRNKPEKRKLCGWVNIDFDGHATMSFKTKERADRYIGQSRIACVYIEKEYEEGEGLE